jgi:ATP-dependent DNA ligase
MPLDINTDIDIDSIVERKGKPKRTGVMLAVPADNKKIIKLGESFYIQPKLNGERCRTEDFQGNPILLSSYSNSFSFLDNIKKEIKKVWKSCGYNFLFDGEIYVHGWSREKIDSALRRKVNKNHDTDTLQFHIFDINIPLPQKERLKILNSIFLHNLNLNLRFLKLVSTYNSCQNNWDQYAEKFLKLGYEGAILRKIDFPFYSPRRLTGQMLKYKPTEIDCYIILEINEAYSKQKKPKGMVGSFTVKGNDHAPFKVGAGKLSHSQRIDYWNKRKSLKGKTLKVKQGKIITTNSIPTCVVAVEVL